MPFCSTIDPPAICPYSLIHMIQSASILADFGGEIYGFYVWVVVGFRARLCGEAEAITFGKRSGSPAACLAAWSDPSASQGMHGLARVEGVEPLCFVRGDQAVAYTAHILDAAHLAD